MSIVKTDPGFRKLLATHTSKSDRTLEASRHVYVQNSECGGIVYSEACKWEECGNCRDGVNSPKTKQSEESEYGRSLVAFGERLTRRFDFRTECLLLSQSIIKEG
ncbi:hypothetical protein ACOSQ4_022157 [Xanthoceras sorbifolium]